MNYEGQCLLTAVSENPDDDAPRVACADWLEENGDPDWAELIRVQVEVADHGFECRPDLRLRLRERMAPCGDRLRAALPTVPGVIYQVARGFPIAVAAGPPAAAAFLRAGPPAQVTGLRLRNLRGFRRLAGRPELRAVRSLDLTGCRVTRGHARLALAESPHLAGLVRLGLRFTGARWTVAVAIAQNPALAGLKALDLTGNPRLALPRLVGLLLTARSALADLDLSRTEPTAGVLWEWVSDPAAARLAILRLNRNKLGDSGAFSLAMSTHLGGLGRLELRGNGITEVGARLLADAPHLGKLSVLDLQHNPIPPAAAAALRARFGKNVRLDS